MKTDIIFDMDGVLFDSERINMNAFIQAYKENGIVFTKEDYLNYIGRSDLEDYKDILNRTSGNIDLANKIYSRFKELSFSFESNINEYKKFYLDDCIKVLKKNGFTLHIASSTKSEIIENRLINTGLKKYFKYILGGDDVNSLKPSPEIYNTLAKKINKDKKHILIIEDSSIGVSAGYIANIDVIMIPDILKPSIDDARKTLVILENLKIACEFILNLDN